MPEKPNASGSRLSGHTRLARAGFASELRIVALLSVVSLLFGESACLSNGMTVVTWTLARYIAAIGPSKASAWCLCSSVSQSRHWAWERICPSRRVPWVLRSTAQYIRPFSSLSHDCLRWP